MKLALLITALTLSSLLAQPQARADLSEHVPPEVVDLSIGGSRLGKWHNFIRRPAVRLYLDKVEGEPGSYYGILFQYASLPTILPQYFTARKAPQVNKIIGYLKRIGTRISVFKLVPGKTFNNRYVLKKLKVDRGKLVSYTDPKFLGTLDLAREISLQDPLGGASIWINGKRKVTFPRDGGFPLKGAQYDFARIAYGVPKLESTWRKQLIRGPYLAAYGKLDDVALNFTKNVDGSEVATFSTDPNYINTPVEERERIFTSKLSAHIEGSFNVERPVPGMFVFSPRGEGQKGAEHVVNRIGLFIDIFDATKALNQDVVEIAFVNPEDPKDFLMYYEHPDNGEGS